MEYEETGRGIIVLPKSISDRESWDQLIEKFKKFRLDALRNSPEAFASNLAKEQAFSKEIWEGRLTNPRAICVVIVDYPFSGNGADEKTELYDLLEEDWLALSVLIRPGNDAVAFLSSSKSPWESIKNTDTGPN